MSAITLPSVPGVAACTPRLIDFDLFQRSGLGGPTTQIHRPGARFAAQVAYPPMDYDTARVFISRLLRARRDGLLGTFSLVGTDQGLPGNPVVNATVNGGTNLPVRGLTPGYVVEEGFWFNVVDSAGQHYLHNVAAPVVASAGGVANITPFPALRAPLVSGNLVILDRPVIEGLVVDPPEWTAPRSRCIPLAFTVEELS